MKSSAEITINAPVQEVFDYTLNHVAEWSTIVVEDKITSDGPVGVGTTFHTITEERGNRMEFEGEVTEHEIPSRHRIFMKGDSFDMDVIYTFEPSGDKATLLTQHSDVTAKGFLKVFFFLFGWLMKKGGCDAVKKELNNLKDRCEAQAGRSNED